VQDVFRMIKHYTYVQSCLSVLLG